MTGHEDSVRDILRSSDEAQHILEAVVVSLEPSAASHDPSNSIEDSKDAASITDINSDNQRILALVIHKDNKGGREEGCLFVFKSKANLAVKVLEIQRAFPITSNFSISIAQQRLGAPSATLTSALEQSRIGLNVTITAGSDGGPEPITLLVYDAQRLRSVLGECKRLKDLHNHAVRSHLWLVPYVSVHHKFSLLSSDPLDLRIAHQPLHTRLSPSSAGFPGDEKENIQIVRDDWLHKSARTACANSPVPSKKILSIHLGTFNVNGKVPSQDLSPWVLRRPHSQTPQPVEDIPVLQEKGKMQAPGSSSPSQPLSPLRALFQHVIPKSRKSDAEPNDLDESCYREPDILVFAFQELDLSAETLLYSSSTTREDAWHSAVFAALGEKAVSYEKLASKQMVGVLLAVIVRKSLKSCFHDVKTSSAGVGILGVMGNKGGAALRMKFTPPATPEIPSPCAITLTFVNSHLAAFDEMAEKRNTDFHDLSTRLDFKSEDDPPLCVYETDALFWMVNLNYRIDLPDADVRTVLTSKVAGNLETLLKYDQLTNVISAKKAFSIFSEHPITHLPTYRFSTGVLTDNLGYDTKRKPAWTDRILHAASPSATIKQLSYTGHPQITISDHRPVSANLNISFSNFDKTQWDMAIRKFCDLVSGMEHSEETPVVLINPKNIELGDVAYKRKTDRTVTLQNVGKVPCVFYFVPVELGVPIHPPWLSVEPKAGLLLPDKTLLITLSVYVDNDCASELHQDMTRTLNTTLILHTARGHDYFISVIGEYDLTCFANKLTDLTRLPGPIHTVKSAEDLLPVDRAVNAPREIVRLVNWLMSNAAAVSGIFTSPAEDELVDKIRECLDTGDEFPFDSSNDSNVATAFGSALLQLLDSLTEPVVPPSIHARCVEVQSRDEAFELLDAFPSVSVNVWISITAFLHFVSLQGLDSQSHADKTEILASVFSPVLLRDSNKSYAPVSPLRKRRFLLYFIS